MSPHATGPVVARRPQLDMEVKEGAHGLACNLIDMLDGSLSGEAGDGMLSRQELRKAFQVGVEQKRFATCHRHVHAPPERRWSSIKTWLPAGTPTLAATRTVPHAPFAAHRRMCRHSPPAGTATSRDP